MTLKWIDPKTGGIQIQGESSTLSSNQKWGWIHKVWSRESLGVGLANHCLCSNEVIIIWCQIGKLEYYIFWNRNKITAKCNMAKVPMFYLCLSLGIFVQERYVKSSIINQFHTLLSCSVSVHMACVGCIVLKWIVQWCYQGIKITSSSRWSCVVL